MEAPALNAPKELPARLRRRVVAHRIRNSVIVGSLLAAALVIGAIGYHYTNDLPWLDAFLNASMILTGMGPVAPLIHPGAKVFATLYALFSGVFFITMVALLLAPAVRGFLHRFHLELHEDQRDRD